MRFERIAGVALVLVGLVCGEEGRAFAQVEGDGGVRPFLDCADVADSLQRLVCYDEAVAASRRSGAKGAARTVPAPALRTPGAAPTVPPTVLGDPDAEALAAPAPENLSVESPAASRPVDAGKGVAGTFAVTAIRRIGRDIVVALDNGQVWQQTDGRDHVLPRAGALSAEVVPAFQGSAFLSVRRNGAERIRKMRVKRLR